MGYYGGGAVKYGIYTNSDTGGTERPLIESPTVRFQDPRWGKGDYVYFLSGYQGETRMQIYSIDFDGKNIQRLSKDTLTQYSALDFSPVNERFLYRKEKGGIKQLCSNNLQLNDEKVLVSGDADGSWNPNGRNVVYTYSEPNSSGQQVSNIYLMNADGTGKTKITNNNLPTPPTTYLNPYISPDGTRIAYTSLRERQVRNTNLRSTLMDVYTANIDGSNEQRITDAVPQTDFWYNANWARDSKKVLVIRYGFRISYDLRLRNTDDNSDKGLSNSWLEIDADIK